MPSPRDLLRRIKSVKNTSQITKAMQMVAASKMRRAQQTTISGRPYAALMNSVLSEVTGHAGEFSHPLMAERPVRRRAVVLISSDRGLCGALNSNLFREAAHFDVANTVFITAGKKSAQFVARTRRELKGEFNYKDTPLFSEARAISKFAQDLFTKGEVDEVVLMFNNFVSTLVQQPTTVNFLPVGEIRKVSADVHGADVTPALDPMTGSFEFEPNANEVLGAMLPHYLNFRIFQALLEAKASEQSARMVAMKNATDNAQQLIKDLTLKYNKLRQTNITKELLEISSAQMALG